MENYKDQNSLRSHVWGRVFRKPIGSRRSPKAGYWRRDSRGTETVTRWFWLWSSLVLSFAGCAKDGLGLRGQSPRVRCVYTVSEQIHGH